MLNHKNSWTHRSFTPDAHSCLFVVVAVLYASLQSKTRKGNMGGNNESNDLDAVVRFYVTLLTLAIKHEKIHKRNNIT